MNAVAQAPTPNVLPQHETAAGIAAGIEGIEDAQYCSHTAGLKDLCVTQLRSALDGALPKMLEQFFHGGDSKYKATFRFVELTHNFASATAPGVNPAVRVSMKWQFVLESPDGKKVLQLAETTEGPNAFTNVYQLDAIVKELLSAVLERIAQDLNKLPA